MGKKVIDMTAYEKGRIKVIERAGKNASGNILWKYQCSCGKTGKATAYRLQRMNSCGCIYKERKREFFRNYNTTHGESKTRLYIIWANMIKRTTNKESRDYKNYGERGITVCEEWKDYLSFKKWALANGYLDTLTLDRIENNKGYCPSNCRWTDRETQDNNKQQSRRLEYKGKIQSVEQWAKEYNINRSTLVNRLNRGMSIKEALEVPVKAGKGKGYNTKKKKF